MGSPIRARNMRPARCRVVVVVVVAIMGAVCARDVAPNVIDNHNNNDRGDFQQQQGIVVGVGSVINARWSGQERYYTGEIMVVNPEDGTVDIQYDLSLIHI